MLTDEQQNQLKDILRLIPPDEQAAFLDMKPLRLPVRGDRFCEKAQTDGAVHRLPAAARSAQVLPARWRRDGLRLGRSGRNSSWEGKDSPHSWRLSLFRCIDTAPVT